MDGGGWMSELRLNQTFVESGYQEDSVRLTVIKKGGDVYYLCNDEFVAHDYVDKITGKNVVGLYANGAAEFSDWSFKDYTNDAQGLNEVLSQYLYFINFKTSGRGLVTADRLAVPRTDGKAEITRHLACGLQYLSTCSGKRFIGSSPITVLLLSSGPKGLLVRKIVCIALLPYTSTLIFS
jgi:hypothetical protein